MLGVLGSAGAAICLAPCGSALEEWNLREIRQFESIFVLQEARSQTVRAWPQLRLDNQMTSHRHPFISPCV
jgi:hypothetical protein